VFWGDGTSADSVSRIDFVSVENNIRKNTYYDVHTYPTPAPAPYLIKIEDPNRNAGLVNMPNSVNVVFYLEAELYINTFLGENNSPNFLQCPIQFACVGEVFNYNSEGIDLDGDSLYYSLQPSRREGGQSIPGYEFPQASNSITVNGFTGDLVWDSPIFQGEYNFSILVEEYRNEIKIGSVSREIHIIVTPICLNITINCEGTVGVDVFENEIIDDLSFPNPTHGKIYIKGLIQKGIDVNSFAIINSLGETFDTPIKMSENIVEVDLSNFPVGIYFFRIQEKDTLRYHKIIKN
jgi:hypothetical protein